MPENLFTTEDEQTIDQANPFAKFGRQQQQQQSPAPTSLPEQSAPQTPTSPPDENPFAVFGRNSQQKPMTPDEFFGSDMANKDRGIIAETTTNIARGAADTVELTGQAMKTFGAEDTGQWLVDKAKKVQDSNFLSADKSEREGSDGFVKRGVQGGVRSAVPSLTSGLGGAAAGAAIGSVVPGVGTAAGGLIGGALGALGLFGAGVYGQEKDRALEAGLSADDAHAHAMNQALVKGGIEAIATPIELMTAGFGKAATQPVKQTIKQLLKTPAKDLLKNYAKTMGVETSTEMLQSGLGAELSKKYGLNESSTSEAVLESIIPALTMSLMFGAGAHGYNALQQKKMRDAMTDANTDGKTRAGVANAIWSELNKADKELAESWRLAAQDAITTGKAIDIDQNFSDFAAERQKRELLGRVEQSRGTIANIAERGGAFGVADIPQQEPNIDAVNTSLKNEEMADRKQFSAQGQTRDPYQGMTASEILEAANSDIDWEQQAGSAQQYNQQRNQKPAQNPADTMDEALNEYDPQIPVSPDRRNWPGSKPITGEVDTEAVEWDIQAQKAMSYNQQRNVKPAPKNEPRQREYTPAEIEFLNEYERGNNADNLRAYPGAPPQHDGYISDQEAKKFEAKVLKQLRSKQANEARMAYMNKLKQADDIISSPEIPDEVKRESQRQAKDIVDSDPVYQHMAEAKRLGGINLDSFKADYDATTVSQIIRRYPGLFSKSGTINADEFAADNGYKSLDDMVQSFSHAKTKKELVADIATDLNGRWQDADAIQKKFDEQTDRETFARTTGKAETVQPRASYPAPESDINVMVERLKANPEAFSDDDLNHWSFSPDQKKRLMGVKNAANKTEKVTKTPNANTPDVSVQKDGDKPPAFPDSFFIKGRKPGNGPDEYNLSEQGTLHAWNKSFSESTENKASGIDIKAVEALRLVNAVGISGLSPKDVKRGYGDIFHKLSMFRKDKMSSQMELAAVMSDNPSKKQQLLDENAIIYLDRDEETFKETYKLTKLGRRIVDSANKNEREIYESKNANLASSSQNKDKNNNGSQTLKNEPQTTKPPTLPADQRTPDTPAGVATSGAWQDKAQKPNAPAHNINKYGETAKRGKPKNTVVFAAPIKGANGSEISAYKWSWTGGTKFDAKEGGEVEARVSDWENAVENPDTGRQIVHQFDIVTPDGDAKTVSLESAQKLLGINGNLLNMVRYERNRQTLRRVNELRKKAEHAFDRKTSSVDWTTGKTVPSYLQYGLPGGKEARAELVSMQGTLKSFSDYFLNSGKVSDRKISILFKKHGDRIEQHIENLESLLNQSAPTEAGRSRSANKSEAEIAGNFESAREGQVYRYGDRYAVRGDNPRGFGDSIFQTYQEAIDHIAFIEKRDKANAEFQKKEDAEAEVRREKAAKEKAFYEDVNGFVDGKKPFQAARELKVLNKLTRLNGKVIPRKDFVRQLLDSGAVLEERQENKIQPMSRTQFNRATQKEQDDHERKIKEAGKKTVYSLVANDKTFYDITKIEYDYAKHLQSLPAAQPSADTVTAPSKGEASRSIQFNPENRLKLIADEPSQVRAMDLDRLRDDVGEDWPAMAKYLLDHPETPDRVKNEIKAVQQSGEKTGQGTEDVGEEFVFSKDDIPLNRATAAYSGSSFSPDKAGVREQESFVSQMQSVVDKIKSSKKFKENRDELIGWFNDYYKPKYQKMMLAYLDANSRTMSPMITGPSNFPVRSNQKKLDTADKRREEFLSWNKKALNSLRSKLSNKGPISSTDPDARQKLQDKLTNLEKAQDVMRNANKIVRNKKLSDAEKIEQLKELGITKEPQTLLEPDYAGRVGFASYALQNNNAEIKRIKGRIAELEKRQEKADETGGAETKEFDGGSVEINHEDGFLRIYHDSKPDEETRGKLKSGGFRWSPKDGAWRRKVTTQAKWKAEEITGVKFSKKSPITNPSTPASTKAELIASQGRPAILSMLRSGVLNIVETQEEAQGIIDVLRRGVKYAAAWHGTATKDIKQLSTDYVGSGEGQRYFGFGLYVSQSKGIAESYRRADVRRKKRNLPKRNLGNEDVITVNGNVVYNAAMNVEALLGAKQNNTVLVGREIAAAKGDFNKALRSLQNDYNFYSRETGGVRDTIRAIGAESRLNLVKEWIENGATYRNNVGPIDNIGDGQLYKVEIPEDDDIIYWDRAISKNSEKVKTVVKNLPIKTKLLFFERDGKYLYSKLTEAFGSPSKSTAKMLEDIGLDPYGDLSRYDNDQLASMYLLSKGIKGIKYRAGTISGANSKAHNYVIFDGADTNIVEVFYAKDGKTIAGFSDGKSSWLVADGIEQGKAPAVLLHEAGVHVGKFLAGDKVFQNIVDSLPGRADEQNATGEAIREAISKVPTDTDPKYYNEEIAAYLVEGNKTNIGIVRRIIARVKLALSKIFGRHFVRSLTADDLKSLAIDAVRRQAKQAGADLSGVKFSQQQAEPSVEDDYVYRYKNDAIGDAFTQWADDPEAITHFGKTAWRVPNNKLMPVSEFSELVSEAYDRSEEDGTLPNRIEGMTKEEVLESINPESIVESALLWDGTEANFDNWIYENVIEPNSISGIKTNDGAVVFDNSIAEKVSDVKESSASKFKPIDTNSNAFKEWFSNSFLPIFSGKTSEFKRRMNSWAGNAEKLSNFLESESRFFKPDGFIEIPPDMMHVMSSMAANKEILDSVIKFVPVDVMDIFGRFDLTPNDFLSNKSMLKDLAFSNPNISIPSVINGVASFIKSVAFVSAEITKFPSLKSLGVSGENLAAKLAGNGMYFHYKTIPNKTNTGNIYNTWTVQNTGEFSENNPDIRYSESPSNFLQWFGKSKVKNIVYHGSPTFGKGENFTFDVNRSDSGAKTRSPLRGLGTFFTEDENEALSYAGATGEVQQLRLLVENPLQVYSWNLPQFKDAAEATAFRKRKELQGYDGIYIKDENHWVIFDANQAKGIDNKTYSRTNNDIRYSVNHMGAEIAENEATTRIDATFDTGIYDRPSDLAKIKEGATIDLIREPDNEFDTDAIRAEIAGVKVGYVSRIHAPQLSDLLDDKVALTAKIRKVVNAENGKPVFTITITAPDGMTDMQQKYWHAVRNIKGRNKDGSAFKEIIDSATVEPEIADFSQEIEEAAKEVTAKGSSEKNWGKKALKFLSGLKQDKMNHVLSVFTTQQIDEVWGKSFPPVKVFRNAAKNMAALTNELLQEADRLHQKWSSMDKKVAADMADVMFKATTVGFDPAVAVDSSEYSTEFIDMTQKKLDEKQKALEANQKTNMHPQKRIKVAQRLKTDIRKLRSELRGAKELIPMYQKLPKEAREMYVSVRDAYKTRFEQLRDALVEQIERTSTGKGKRQTIAAIRLEFEKQLNNGPYFPLSRFGDHFVEVQKVVDGVTVDRMVRTFERYNNAEEFAQGMREKGYLVSLKRSKEYQPGQQPDPGFVSEIMNIVNAAEMAPEERRTVMDEVNQAVIKMLPDLSHRKRFIHRKGVKGYSQDAQRAFASHMLHAAKHISKIKHGWEMADSIKELEMSKYAHDEKSANIEGALRNELAKRYDLMMNANVHPVAQVLTSLGFAWNIGPSIASAVVNMTQTPLVAYPLMSARFGWGSSSRALLRASRDYTKGDLSWESGISLEKAKFLNTQERAMFEELIKDGTIDVSQAHDLASAAATDYLSLSEKGGNLHKYAKAMKVISAPFHYAEVANRQVTALATYRLAKTKGMNHAEAVEEARQIVEGGHFDYSSGNRARIMQGNLARVALLFKQYSQQMTFRLARDLQVAFKKYDVTKEEQRRARLQLAGILGGHFLVTGALGMPTIGVVGSVMNALASAFGGDDEPWDFETETRNFLADTLGVKGGEVLSHGVARGILPVDVAGRLSLSDLWWRGDNRDLEGRELFNHYMMNILGPTASNAAGVFSGAAYMAEGDYWKGAEMMLPKFVKDIGKSMRYASEGVTNKQLDVLVDDLNILELSGQLLGFTPARVAEMYEGKAAVKKIERKLQERRTRLTNRYIRAFDRQDEDALKKVRVEIQEWNKIHSDVRALRITQKSLRTSYRRRMNYRNKTENGIYLPKTREYLRDIGRFAAV